MKMLKHTARLILSLAVIAAPAAAFSQNKKAEDPVMMEPVKSVLENYVAIQKELAKDSIKGLDEHGAAISKAVKGDEMKMLPMDVAKQADTLAQAKDIRKARQAFKRLSASLVKYLADNKAGKGTYHEAYCPMARASWLQTGTDIRNPYMGRDMLSCGELKN